MQGNVLISKINKKSIVILMFAVMLCVGLLTIGDYGQPLDEQWEYSLMLANAKEYVLHLPDSKIKDKLNNLYIIRDIKPISQTGESDHGEAAYHPYVVLTIILGGLFRPWILHAYTFSVFMLGVLSMYFIVKKLMKSRCVGLLAAMLLYLTPRMFAQAHYNNKDIVLLALSLFTLWMGLEMLEKDKYRYAVLFGLGGAVAANTKIAGAWFFGTMGLAYLGRFIHACARCGIGAESLHRLKVGIAAIVVFFAGYWLVTPGMWDDPVGFIQYLVINANSFERWDGYVLFNGEFYRASDNPLPNAYIPWMIAMTVPVSVLAGVAAGLARNAADVCRWIAIYRKGDENAEASVSAADGHMMWYMLFFAVLWLFPLAYAVVTGTKVYNGWRHFYFVYGPMVVTCVYGMEWLGRLVKSRIIRRGLAGAILVALAIGLAANRSSQQAYYNILAGTDVEDRYELDYWDVSILDALKRIKALDGESTVLVGSCENWTLSGLKKTLRMIDDDRLECVDWQTADWLILNPTYVKLNPSEDLDYVIENYDLAYEKKSYGNVVMRVYRRRG
jgi:hypothetical protein